MLSACEEVDPGNPERLGGEACGGREDFVIHPPQPLEARLGLSLDDEVDGVANSLEVLYFLIWNLDVKLLFCVDNNGHH